MPRACTVCNHPKRAEIDTALTSREASNRRIASQYDVTERAIRSHKTNHLKERLIKAAETDDRADLRTAIDVVKQLRGINTAALMVLKNARDAGDGELALKATDRILKQLELQAKLIGELSDGDTININVNAEWVTIRAAAMTALQNFPEARIALAEALEGHDARTAA